MSVNPDASSTAAATATGDSERQYVIAKTFSLRDRVRRFEVAIMAVFGILLVLAPLLRPGDNYVLHILVTGFVFAMLAASWDVAMGYTGQLSVAHIAFFATGGYSWAQLENAGLNAWLALIAAMALSALLGVAVGYLCLRFRGPYILVVTLALIEILRIIVLTFRETTGGSRGLTGYGRLPGIESVTANYYLGLGLLVAVTAGLGWLGRSMLGKRFRAIRENSTKAEMIGIDTVRYKVLAFVISASVAGLAGAYFAQYIRVLTPGVFEVTYLVYPIAMAIIGGVGTVFGPVLGSMVFISATEALRGTGVFWENILLGLVLVGVMLFKPQGLWNMAVDSYENRVRRKLFGEIGDDEDVADAMAGPPTDCTEEEFAT